MSLTACPGSQPLRNLWKMGFVTSRSTLLPKSISKSGSLGVTAGMGVFTDSKYVFDNMHTTCFNVLVRDYFW